jgi:hypothetical protein
VGTNSDTEGASTAAGPISEAAIADIGSDVLRQEQERESDGDVDFPRVWCIGHICPSPWSHVHSAPMALADVVEQMAVGTDTSKLRWSTSQPPATPRTQRRMLCIRGQPNTIHSTHAWTDANASQTQQRVELQEHVVPRGPVSRLNDLVRGRFWIKRHLADTRLLGRVLVASVHQSRQCANSIRHERERNS